MPIHPDSNLKDLGFERPDSPATDVLCQRCGYDLYGLDPASNCPECGTTIEESLHGDLLRYADPAWRRMIMRGMAMLAWGGAILSWTLWIVLIGGLLLIAVSLAQMLAGTWMVVPPAIVIGCAICIGASAALVFACLGAWLVTTPEPREDSELGQGRARIVARCSLLMLIIVGAVCAASQASSNIAGSIAVRGAGVCASGLTVSLTVLSLMFHVMTLARRAEAHELARKGRSQFTTLRWLLPTTVALLTIDLTVGLKGTGAPRNSVVS